MRRLLVATLATVAGLADAQDGGCTDFMTMQANYMALVSLLSTPAPGLPSLTHQGRPAPPSRPCAHR